MPEFKAITTQEDFDAAIKTRLDRHTKTVTAEVEKKFEGYLSPEDRDKLTGEIDDLKKQLAASGQSVADLTDKLKKAETGALRTRIAADKHLPPELAERLQGETEDELKADADSLSKLVGTVHRAPLFEPGSDRTGSVSDAALLATLGELKN